LKSDILGEANKLARADFEENGKEINKSKT